jgi:uncharacterized protein YodC (DUF2158 family)
MSTVFRVGDTVRLKDGGSFGTVQHIDRMHKDSVGVGWGTPDGSVYYEPKALVTVSRPECKTSVALSAVQQAKYLISKRGLQDVPPGSAWREQRLVQLAKTIIKERKHYTQRGVW